MDSLEIKRISKKYNKKKLNSHKFDNLDEMDQFLERHNPPKLTREEINDLNRIYMLFKRNK